MKENPDKRINLGNLDTYTKLALKEFISSKLKGVATGVATLDEEGKVPIDQLPSSEPSIIETNDIYEFPTVGKTGVLYVTKKNEVYRWDDENTKYYRVGSDIEDVTVIDGGLED